MTSTFDPARLLAEAPRVDLAASELVLMPHREGPAMVHGVVPPSALPGLAAHYAEGGAGVECAWSLDDGRPVAAVRVGGTGGVCLVLMPDLEPDALEGMVRRPRLVASMYPSEEARQQAMADFRIGGVRGDWERLGIHLPASETAPLRAAR